MAKYLTRLFGTSAWSFLLPKHTQPVSERESVTDSKAVAASWTTAGDAKSTISLCFFLCFVVVFCPGFSPNLTWRDMQHLSVLTSKRNQLHDEVHQWRRNGVGLEFNHLFGYGVLDAGGMVKMAKDWKTVPERFHCVAGSIQETQ